MKKILLCLFTLFLTTAALAITHSKSAPPKTSDDQIILYAAPQSKTVLERVPGDVALIPIYWQKAWVKVGDPRNG